LSHLSNLVFGLPCVLHNSFSQFSAACRAVCLSVLVKVWSRSNTISFQDSLKTWLRLWKTSVYLSGSP
jgi:hypothetical protein